MNRGDDTVCLSGSHFHVSAALASRGMKTPQYRKVDRAFLVAQDARRLFDAEHFFDGLTFFFFFFFPRQPRLTLDRYQGAYDAARDAGLCFAHTMGGHPCQTGGRAASTGEVIAAAFPAIGLAIHTIMTPKCGRLFAGVPLSRCAADTGGRLNRSGVNACGNAT